MSAAIRRSGPLIMTCPLASYSEVPQTACVKKGGEREEKSIGFPLSGWPVSLACQRSCYSVGTRLTQAQTQSLLTTRKHADRHREQVGTQICTSSSSPRRYCARPPQGEGRAQLVWGGGGGRVGGEASFY